jgi:hypothetical protein
VIAQCNSARPPLSLLLGFDAARPGRQDHLAIHQATAGVEGDYDVAMSLALRRDQEEARGERGAGIHGVGLGRLPAAAAQYLNAHRAAGTDPARPLTIRPGAGPKLTPRSKVEEPGCDSG